MKPAAPRFHYAWIAAGVTFFTLLAAAGALCVIAALVVLPIGKARRFVPQSAAA